MTETPKSPLEEADPRSLDELYYLDPLSLTDPDLDRMVDNQIEKRALWAQAEVEAASKGTKKPAKAYLPKTEKGSIDLNDLGIGGLRFD